LNEPDFKDREAFDADERELCPDGACTGLIGANGRCKVCGLAGDGSRARSPHEAATRDADEHASRDEHGSREDLASPDDDDRQLCPDGACIGIIGSDGKCKVCGIPAAS
jgi:hypothetical protein